MKKRRTKRKATKRAMKPTDPNQRAKGIINAIADRTEGRSSRTRRPPQ